MRTLIVTLYYFLIRLSPPRRSNSTIILSADADRGPSGFTFQKRPLQREVSEMREVCYCGKTGKVENREPILDGEGR
jgi:hypothetical protein